MRNLVLAVLIFGCSESFTPPPDVVGPFPGTPKRYAVTSLSLPPSKMQYASDLNGDKKLDNQLGNIVDVLSSSLDSALNPNDQIAAGVIQSVVEIADDDPSHVGVRFLGAEGEGGDFVGGTIVNGAFASNQTRYTLHPASMTVHLPLFLDVNPVVVHLVGVEISLLPNGDGWDGQLNGAIRKSEVGPLAASGVAGMYEFNPYDHPYFPQLFDFNQDGAISPDEVTESSAIKNIILPDVALFDAAGNWHPDPTNAHKDAFSIGFAFHLVPCDSGRCSTAAVVDPCHDRAQEDDETDLDCGGSSQCMRCLDGRACQADSDCRSGKCDANVCAPTACSNFVLDGDETDLDCGGSCNAGCEEGRHCQVNSDCAAGLSCNATYCR